MALVTENIFKIKKKSGNNSLKLQSTIELLNNVAGHMGLLADWTPWLVASVPSALYLLLALVAFSWLVRYR